ncbi:MAG: TolC family protein [Candidatus Marinimicrobia bacterium]|nr:TolC family protein [Candidatus Neomarinimicrobiota bacterium]
MDIPAHVSSLDELIELSLSRNSGFRAQYAAWRTNQEAVNTISRLPDPSLGVGYFIEPVETAQGPQTAKISLGQTIPWFSKIRAAREIGGYQSIERYRALEAERISLIRELNYLWAEAAHLQSMSSIVEAKLALSRDLEEILKIQYQGASISHKKLMEVQIQALQLGNDLHDVESQFHRLSVKLGSILELGGPVPDNFLPLQSSIFVNDISPGSVSKDHPRLQGLDAMVQEAQARRASARASYVPDLKIGLDYILTDKRMTDGLEIPGSGKDPLIVSAGIALPLWNWKSKRAEVKASEWREIKAHALLSAEISKLAREYEISRSMLDDELRLIQLYEEQLIPKAREIEKVMQQEYIGQSSDVFSYTMARQHVLDLELALSNVQYSAQLHLADLSYLKGN